MLSANESDWKHGESKRRRKTGMGWETGVVMGGEGRGERKGIEREEWKVGLNRQRESKCAPAR